MLNTVLKNHRILLASRSPRRQDLLRQLGPEFSLVAIDVEETYPEYLQGFEIACYLAALKADAFKTPIKEGEILLTADTVVWAGGQALGKPRAPEEAVAMLELLSGKQHEVITAVCLKTSGEERIFHDCTEVQFKSLSPQEIRFYVDQYKPFDKAGAYAIQEWIGMIGIQQIKGSYFNVVGLPVQKLYEQLIRLFPNPQ